jgi:NAD(P)H-hydrate epimerase
MEKGNDTRHRHFSGPGLFSGPEDVRRAVKARNAYSHKGDSGYLLIVGGSDVYSGAPALAGMAALRTGAGLVVIAAPRGVAGIVRSYSPELIVHSLKYELISSSIGSYQTLLCRSSSWTAQ